jgi:acetyl-CoA synthetase
MKIVSSEVIFNLGLPAKQARAMAGSVNRLMSTHTPQECWQVISQDILSPVVPFDIHKYLFNKVYEYRPPVQGPPPAWVPGQDYIRATNPGKLMRSLKIKTYQQLHQWSVNNREKFWDLMIKKLGIPFKKPYSHVLNLSAGAQQPWWLPGSRLNIADSCFIAPKKKTAIVYQAENSPIKSLTYEQLELFSNRTANGLRHLGLKAGDTVACCLPMTVEAVALYLGIIKNGCVAVSIAESFAPVEIKKRLKISKAKAIFTQDCLIRSGKRLPLYKKVIEADGPMAIVIPVANGLDLAFRKKDIVWDAFLSDNDKFKSVKRRPDDYSNILFSSGTTGEPKAIPWTHTTPIKCAADGCLHQDIRPGDIAAWPTSLGWMMGPWLIYASLINKAAMALYYGAPTDKGFTKFIQEAKVTMLGVVPSLVKAWRLNNCINGSDWSGIRVFSSTGECSNAEDMLYLMSRAGYKPVIEYCGGTEIGGGYITGTVVQPSSPGIFTTPALGLDFTLKVTEGAPASQGEVFLKPPSLGLSTSLLNKDHHKVYYKGTPTDKDGGILRRHGDQLEKLPGGMYRALGRADDTMNLGGIKVSSAEIERVLNKVPGISETAAVAVADIEGGPLGLVIYAVVAKGKRLPKNLLLENLQKEIKNRLNPLFKIRSLKIIDALPRTASNKVMRRKLRDMCG